MAMSAHSADHAAADAGTPADILRSGLPAMSSASVHQVALDQLLLNKI